MIEVDKSQLVAEYFAILHASYSSLSPATVERAVDKFLAEPDAATNGIIETFVKGWLKKHVVRKNENNKLGDAVADRSRDGQSNPGESDR
jgi:uncharacterized iron-regulated protein